MGTDQEVQDARTFRASDSLRNSPYSNGDADWYRTKMRVFLNAHRYRGGSLHPIQLLPKPGQNFLEYLTPWEREWSVLARAHQGGFTPIVDESGTVIAHRGVTGTTWATNLIAPYGDLFYTLPELTLTNTRGDAALKSISNWGIRGTDLSQLLKDGASIFVFGRTKPLPPDWRRLSYIPAETRLTLYATVDGEVFDFDAEITGFLKEGYSPVDFFAVGRIGAYLGTKIGTRIITALFRKKMATAHSSTILKGPTAELAKEAEKKLENIKDFMDKSYKNLDILNNQPRRIVAGSKNPRVKGEPVVAKEFGAVEREIHAANRFAGRAGWDDIHLGDDARQFYNAPERGGPFPDVVARKQNAGGGSVEIALSEGKGDDMAKVIKQFEAALPKIAAAEKARAGGKAVPVTVREQEVVVERIVPIKFEGEKTLWSPGRGFGVDQNGFLLDARSFVDLKVGMPPQVLVNGKPIKVITMEYVGGPIRPN